MAQQTNKSGKVFMTIMGVVGVAIGGWALFAIGNALSQSGFQVSQLLQQYLVAVGAIGEHETLVDYYTNIKGIEYIICVAFFVAFPVFFKYIDRAKTRVPVNR